MRDYLGVGLRFELNSISFESVAQFSVVFDDPVVCDRYLAVVTEMRVCVRICRCAMSRPASMANPCRRLSELTIDRFFQSGNSTCAFDRSYPIAVYSGDSCAVVASVLEVFERSEQEGLCIAVAGVTHDSTHVFRADLLLVDDEMVTVRACGPDSVG